MSIQTILENLVNGNLRDAKNGAEGKAGVAIIAYASMVLGWTETRALRAAQYLKGDGSFQAYCDASVEGNK